jgi:hypothetical protein
MRSPSPLHVSHAQPTALTSQSCATHGPCESVMRSSRPSCSRSSLGGRLGCCAQHIFRRPFLANLVKMFNFSREGEYVCHCGRSFSGNGPLNLHRRKCKPRKRLLEAALPQLKDLWNNRKKSRKAPSEECAQESQSVPHVSDLLQAQSSTLNDFEVLPINHSCAADLIS